MKHRSNNLFAIGLTIWLSMTSLQVVAATSSQDHAQVLNAQTLSTFNQSSGSGFLDLNNNQLISSKDNIALFSPPPTGLDFNDQSRGSFANFTVNSVITIADLNLENLPAGLNFRTDLNFANEITELKFKGEAETFERIKIVTSPVPEPSELVLLGSALILLFFVAKRRRLNSDLTAV